MIYKFFTLIFILLSLFFVSPAYARTQLNYQNKNDKDITVVPYLTADKRILYLDFDSKNFKKIESIYFNVNYNSDNGKRGVEGRVTVPLSKDEFKSFKGIPYLRREILLGSCSKNACVYDNNPKNFSVKINIKYRGVLQESTQTLTFN